MKTDAQKAYQRGYYAGSRGRWPEHKPPLPPDEVLSELIQTARTMRDAVDSWLAQFDEGDPVGDLIWPHIDNFDRANEKLNLWLKTQEQSCNTN